MLPDHALPAANLALQLILTAALAYALILAMKGQSQRHCLATRLAFAAQILSILAMMSPAMESILEPGRPNGLFQAEVLAHHALGLAAVLLWVYINLVFLRRIRARLPAKQAMQAAAACWMASLALGFHIYWRMYY